MDLMRSLAKIVLCSFVSRLEDSLHKQILSCTCGYLFIEIQAKNLR